MKQYSSKFLKELQDLVNKKKYKVTSMKSFNDFPKNIQINGIGVCLTEENGVKKNMMYLNDEVTNADIAKWKETPMGKFYAKDWKSGNKGEDNYKFYSVLSTQINIFKINALLREIFESDYIDEETYLKAVDVEIEDKKYTLIKAYAMSTDTSISSIIESFNCNSMLEIKNVTDLIDNYEIEQEKDASFDDLPDAKDLEMVELF